MTRRVVCPVVVYVGGCEELDRLPSELPQPDEEYAAKQLFEKMRSLFSGRELRILEGLAAGVAVEDIAASENLSPSRTWTLVSAIRKKLKEEV